MSTLERLKGLEAKATPAPWTTLWRFDYGFDDVQFIAEMRNALPKLLAVVEALKDSGLITPDIERALMALDDHSVQSCRPK